MTASQPTVMSKKCTRSRDMPPTSRGGPVDRIQIAAIEVW